MIFSKGALPLMALCVVLVGCGSSRIGMLEVAATKPVSTKYEVVNESVEGRSCARYVLFIPISGGKISLDAAIGAALAQAPGANALADASTKQTLVPAVLYNETCWVAEGKAVRVR